MEGIDSGLRFEDIKKIFESQKSFSPTSAVAKRSKGTCDFLANAFPIKEAALKNRTVVQSMVTFGCRLIETGRSTGFEQTVSDFVERFLSELAHQVELGQGATDFDYIRFQKSINANVKGGARIRHEILLRKAFLHDLKLADAFDPSVLRSSGITGHIKELGERIVRQVARINSAYSHIHGEDLFKPTSKTSQALIKIGNPIRDMAGYTELISDLYFLVRESAGQRLDTNAPQSFVDINTLRTDLQHDVDHGDRGKVKAKRKKVGTTFGKYAGVKSPQLLGSSRFVLVQANLLSAIDLDLGNFVVT